MMNQKKSIALKKLYNAIMNDYSIQRYTLSSKDVLDKISKRYKNIKHEDIEFSEELLKQSIDVSEGSFRKLLIEFGNELNINLTTLAEKEIAKRLQGTQRSPFQFGF